MARIWDQYLTERDRAVFAASGWGSRGSFGKRPALVIVDVSYMFTGDRRDEPLLESIKRWHNSCGETSWVAIPVIKRLAEIFHDKGLPVIYTTGEFRDDNWDAGSWAWKNSRTATGAFQAARNRGANEIVEEIAPLPQDVVVIKKKPSGFFESSLLSQLVLLGADSLVIAGTTTSGCVRATVMDAFSYNFRVIVAEDGCFDRSEVSHAINLFDMNTKYADVLSSQEILKYLETLSVGLFPNLPSGKSMKPSLD